VFAIRSNDSPRQLSPLNETYMADQIVITEKTSQAKDVRSAVGTCSRGAFIRPSRKPEAG
jgi:hypothetical protein